ncbi:ParE family toxin-like protein [Enterobacter roggenkampii]|uniref:ParE family toxin-like protein n=1 Tax=Enterobacter roggenkampii TaxID=1812935 RepID=UPI002DB8B2C8|nr:hypothetical protein [Enterobacter roggenkampii]MEB6619609.1 hypothetical protein [Enterobacter roggenkampii]
MSDFSLPTLSGCTAPARIWKSASIELSAYIRGRKNYSRIKPHHYLVIRLGKRWRILSKDNGRHWQLMTHETYNKESKL